MEVLRDQSNCPRPPEGTAVTIGAYDGVHTGHQVVIEELKRRAAARGLRTAVVTFDRHPASVVRPESAPRLLTDLDQKLELLAGTGLDYCLVITFDEARSRETATDFVHDVLTGCLNARLVAVGEDFHFGHGREGNVKLLSELGSELGFDVDGVDLVDPSGHPAEGEADRVSSTRIRAALANGDLVEANALLGREHEMRGIVEPGDRRAGEVLGFPTANVAVPPEMLLPADGVYAGWYERQDGTVWPAALYLGRAPTLGRGATYYETAAFNMVEAHLLGFQGDLYGEPAKVRFTAWIHGDKRYDSVEALVDQIGRDCQDARRILGVD